MTTEDLRNLGLILLAVFLMSLLLGMFFLALAVRELKKIKIPPGTGFADTLHLTPFLVVAAIDLLDLSLDFLAAPIAWIVLDRMGLKALRGLATIEALIPGTQIVPTLTICWFAVRLLNIHDQNLETLRRAARPGLQNHDS
jgi:hypothetical protein